MPGLWQPPDSVLFPSAQSSRNGFFGFFGDFNPFGLKYYVGKIAENRQHQINVTDSLSWVVSAHQIKFGFDYRRLRPEEGALTYELEYEFGSLANVLSNSVPAAFVASRFDELFQSDSMAQLCGCIAISRCSVDFD